MISRVSLYQTSTGAFDAVAYSRFKHGSVAVATEYGQALGAKLLESEALQGLSEASTVLASAAYKHVPSAAYAAFQAAHAWLMDNDHILSTTKIHRSTLIEGDYATMSSSDRDRHMANNGLSVDPRSVDNKNVVVIDDIRVTGSHERSIYKLLSQMHPTSIAFAYIVELDPAQAADDPTLESKLNNYHIRDLPTLAELLDSEPCTVNARTTKMVLSPQHRAQLLDFLETRPMDYLCSLHSAAVSDGYDQMPVYSPSFDLLDGYLVAYTH